VFDRSPAILPTSNATIALGNTSPTASVNMPLTAFLIGTSMANPVTATWPSAASGLTRVDMDANTDPGVTVSYVNGGGFEQPRVGDTFFDDRSSNPYVATRLVFSLQGNLTSCTEASGAATVTQINTRIFGCKIANSSSKCSSGEANFLDQNCLNYNPGSASYRMVKINDGSSCAVVRSTLP